MTIREHLVEAAKFDPEAARELAGPPLPDIARAAWGVFDDLHAARPVAMQGIQPVSYTELDAYMRVTQTPLTGLDVFLVRLIDETYVASIAEAMTPDETEPDPTPAES